MNKLTDITIDRFKPEDQSPARALVLAGLAEHWGWLDPDKNPDLSDIASTYASGVFLVARNEERIVGTGALRPGRAQAAEVVRMSVAADMRRKGIGGRILESLCKEARARGFKTITLETTESWSEAIAFYERFGFRSTHRLEGDVYFALQLPDLAVQPGIQK